MVSFYHNLVMLYLEHFMLTLWGTAVLLSVKGGG